MNSVIVHRLIVCVQVGAEDIERGVRIKNLFGNNCIY